MSDASMAAVAMPSGATPLQRLRALVSLEKRDIWVVVVYSVVVGLVSLTVPAAAQALVNTLAFTALLQPLVVLATLVFLGLLLAGVLRTLQAQIVDVLQQRIFVRAAHTAATALARARASSLDRHRGTVLVNRFFDVVVVQKAVASLLIEGLSVVLQASIALLLMAFYHPALLAFDVVLVACIAFIVFGLGRNGPATAIKESKAKHAVAAWLEEVASAPRALRAPGGAELAFRRVDELARDYVLARRKHFSVLLAQTASSHVLQAIAVAGLLGLGGALVIQGQLTLGQLVAAELIVNSVVLGLIKFGKYLENYYDLLASLDKMGQLEGLVPEREGGASRAEASGAAGLFVDELTVHHEGGRPVLSGVSLSIEPGKGLAVLGADASGKTSLADVLYGLVAPAQGRVEIDGLDVRALTLADLRRDVGLASVPEVFDGTLLENVSLGRADVGAEDVAHALSIASLDGDVARMPDGMNTRLGEGGLRLTGSQAARLSIARAVALCPRLLVVDGVLDGLDDATMRRILERLCGDADRFTLLVLTSREGVARSVGTYLRLREGAVVASSGEEVAA